MSSVRNAVFWALTAYLLGCGHRYHANLMIRFPEDSAQSAAFERYLDEHRRAVGTEIARPASLEELDRRLVDARVLYLGDYHSDRVLHREDMKLVERLSRTRELVFVMEAIVQPDEALTARRLRGEIDDGVFRRSVSDRLWFDGSMGDSAYFLELISFAAARGIPVYGLEAWPRPTLVNRDAGMAETLKRVESEHPNRLVVVVVGEAHLLGEGHLVARAKLPCVVVGGRLHHPLAEQTRLHSATDAELFETNAGIFYFRNAPREYRTTSSAPCTQTCGEQACKASARYSCQNLDDVWVDLACRDEPLSTSALEDLMHWRVCRYRYQTCICM